MQNNRSAREALGVLRRAVEEGRVPGGVLAAGWGSDLELLGAIGWAETGSAPREVSVDTVYDLASLTKVVATLPVVVGLLAEGSLELDTPVAEVLPEFSSEGQRADVAVHHLLTHTSGLPSHRQYWKLGLAPAELRARLLREPLESAPGECVRYSDIGFLVLGWMAEAVAGAPLDHLVAKGVTGPLGLGRTSFGPCHEADVAATEAAGDGTYRVGVVHDETAAALGRPVGHAGLFAPAGDVAAYLAAWTDPSDRWLPAPLRRAACTDRTAGRGGHRGLGWTARYDSYDQLGDAWPATAVFHSGFTGTSVALDLPSRRWVVLLTNDVHFGRDRGTINPLRREIHTALAP